MVSFLFGLLSTDVYSAEEERNRKLLSISQQSRYLPTVNMGGFYGSRDNNYATYDLLIPIHQHADNLFFLDLRAMTRNYPIQEYNVGLGYRWLNEEMTQLYGMYAFFDRKQSQEKNMFNQITIGAELKSQRWSFGSNVYLPVGKTKQQNTSTFAQANAADNNTFTLSQGERIVTENALTGIDAEIGYSFFAVPQVTAYVGGFYFNKDKETKQVTGPRVGMIFDLAPLLGNNLNWLSSFSVETSYQYDDVRKNVWYAGLRLGITIGRDGSTTRAAGLRKEMTSFVRRDIDVVTESEVTLLDFGTWTKNDGTPYVGKIVTTASELASATTAGSGIDIIGVKGQITVDGQTYVDSNTGAAVNLLEGQSITGLGLTYVAGGKTFYAKIVNSDQGIAGADPTLTSRGGLTLSGNNDSKGNLLRVYTSDSGTVAKTEAQYIQDLILRVPQASSTTTQTSVAITNTTGNLNNIGNLDSFGNIVIDNVDTDGITLFRTAADQTGQITIKNSTYTIANSLSGIGAIDLDSEAASDITISDIYNNNFTISNSVQGATGISIAYVNGSIRNNEFSAMTSTGTGAVYGINVRNNVTTSGSITSNTFGNLVSDRADAFGINVSDSMSGIIDDNTFADITTSTGNAHGVYVTNTLSGTLSNNTFGKLTAASQSVNGVEVDGALTGSISGNTFGDISTGNSYACGVCINGNASGSIKQNVFSDHTSIYGDAYGIYVEGNLTGQVDNNTFNNVTSLNADAYGLWFYSNYTGSTSSISGNAFGNVVSGNNYAVGMEILGSTVTGGAITNNSFTKISSLNNEAFGMYISGSSTITSTISNNTFQLIEAYDSDSYGIYLNGNASNTITGNVFGTMRAYDNNADVYGIYLKQNFSGTISNNTFTKMDSYDSKVYGLFFFADLSSGGTISNNTFGSITTHAATEDAYGLYFRGNVAGTISDNTFSSILSLQDFAIGIYQEAGTFNAANVTGNTFNATAASEEKAIGFSLPTGSGTDLSALKANNTFGGEITTDYEAIKR